MKRNTPSKLRVWIGGYFANDYSLTYDGRRLVYTADEHRGPPTEKLIIATSQDWDAFRSEIDAIRIWNWQQAYDNSDICDGVQWEVRMQWGNRKCGIDGSNSYPNEDGTPSQATEPTETFSRFLRAVSRLAGGRAFG